MQWRRKRDSNPRASCPANGFQDRRFQPLTHPSAQNLAIAERDGASASLTRLPHFPCPSATPVAPHFRSKRASLGPALPPQGDMTSPATARQLRRTAHGPRIFVGSRWSLPRLRRGRNDTTRWVGTPTAKRSPTEIAHGEERPRCDGYPPGTIRPRYCLASREGQGLLGPRCEFFTRRAQMFCSVYSALRAVL